MRISKKERLLIAKVKEAVEFAANGDPMKDVIDDDEIREALELLIKILDRQIPAKSE